MSLIERMLRMLTLVGHIEVFMFIASFILSLFKIDKFNSIIKTIHKKISIQKILNKLYCSHLMLDFSEYLLYEKGNTLNLISV